MDAAFRKWETGNHVRVPGTRSPSPWPSIIRIVELLSIVDGSARFTFLNRAHRMLQNVEVLE